MTDRLKIALAQLNPVVGDVAGNLRRLREVRAEAATLGADRMVASELVLSGYPPEDLVLKSHFLEEIEAAVDALALETADGGPALLIGAPWREDRDRQGPLRGYVFNAALLLAEGEVAAVRYKHELPNYGVFDEVRVFQAGPLPGPMSFKGVRLGVMVCEDMWIEDVAECLEESAAEMLIVINGSPFEWDKHDERMQLAVARVVETGLPLVYVNQVGGQDELVFDGGSFVLNGDRSLAVQMPAYESAMSLTQWSRNADDTWHCEAGETAGLEEGLEPIYRALVLGLRDYVEKSGFPGVVIGLSGGIDSAPRASAAMAAESAESMPPERPMTTPGKPLFST